MSLTQATKPALQFPFNGSNVDIITNLSPSITNGTPVYQVGKYNKAYYFNNPTSGNPTSNIYYATIPTFTSTSGFTLSFWFNSTNSSFYYAAVPVELTGTFYYFINGDGKLYPVPASAGGPATPATLLNTWYNIAGVFTNGLLTTYLNGVQSNTHPIGSISANRLSVGSSGAEYPFIGLVQDLRIYNTPLGAIQVQALYNNGGAPSVPASTTTFAQYIKSATGGDTVQDIGGYRIHKFTTVGSSTFTPASSGFVEVLVVGGGGGGGRDRAAGGGAGGLIYQSSYSVSTGAITVTVGGGGAGSITSGKSGSVGSNSKFGSLTAIGGGGGASAPNYGTLTNTGGSGGGGEGQIPTPGGSGTAGQGYSGGNGTLSAGSSWNSGGGGGAGGTGVNATSTSGGDGGPGLQVAISGTAVYYAGGGGGSRTFDAASTSTISGKGGLGGGGDAGQVAGANGSSGTANTGGGGGGGANNPIGLGGAGGSGIVIVRYPLPIRLTGTPLLSQLSVAPVAAFSLRAVGGLSTAKAVNVVPGGAFPIAGFSGASVQATNQFTQTLTGYPFTGSYVANCSSFYSGSGTEQPWRCFDKNNNNSWWTTSAGVYSLSTGIYVGTAVSTTISGSAYYGEWISIQMPFAIILTSYTIYNASSAPTRSPNSFKIAGSNDGTTWTLVDTQTGQTSWYNTATSLTFKPSTQTTAYSYYRLCVNQTNANLSGTQTYLSIGELILNGSVPSLAAQDFYADRLGNLLTAPVTGTNLATWLGGATGYVATWYDQSGAGNNATQGTAANQPQINLTTSPYSLIFAGNGTTSGQSLQTSSVSFAPGAAGGKIGVEYIVGNNTGGCILANGSRKWWLASTSAGSTPNESTQGNYPGTVGNGEGWSMCSTAITSSKTTVVYNSTASGSGQLNYINGTSQSTSSKGWNTNIDGSNPFVIGAMTSGNFAYYSGNLYELIVTIPNFSTGDISLF
jgi:hypothetical protein